MATHMITLNISVDSPDQFHKAFNTLSKLAEHLGAVEFPQTSISSVDLAALPENDEFTDGFSVFRLFDIFSRLGVELTSQQKNNIVDEMRRDRIRITEGP